MPVFDSQNSRVDRPTALLGSAKINLRHLQVEIEPEAGRLGADPKNIERLLDIFEEDKCRPEDPDNRVPVLISESNLNELLRLNNLELADLRRAPLPVLTQIPPNSGLVCLHGYHRLQAGQRFLGPDKQWWGVNIYSREGTSEALKVRLRESRNSAKPYDDGTIFYRARKCQIDGDKRSARKWLAKLTPSKRRDYRQLQRQKKLKGLRKAYDDLLVIPGIWNVLQLGTFHRELTLRCLEEQTCYLRTMLSQFETIFQDNPEQIQNLDNRSASTLQGRSPFCSLEDTAHVQKACKGGELFVNLPLQKRSQALARVLQYDRVLLSMLTYTEDTKWLEAASKIASGLLPRTFRGTIRQGFYKYFRYDPLARHIRQVGEDEYIEISHPTKEAAFSDAYRILFLFAFRSFPYMGDLKPRQTSRDSQLDSKRNRTECWNRFAKLAKLVGFSTPIIEELSATDSDSAVAVDALNCAKPLSYYDTAGLIEANSENLAGILKQVPARRVSKVTPELTGDSFQTWRLLKRCGRPYDQAFQRIERYGYLEYVYAQTVPEQRQAITDFAVFRDTFHAFFGRSLDDILHPLEEEDDDLSDALTSPVVDHAATSDLFPESWASSVEFDDPMQGFETQPTSTTTANQSQLGKAQSEAERLGFEQQVRDAARAEADARVKEISDSAAIAAQRTEAATLQKAQNERTAFERRLQDKAEADLAAAAERTQAAAAALDKANATLKEVKAALEKANTAAQRAQAEGTASEQRIKDKAEADLAAAAERTQAATAALEKANAAAQRAQAEGTASEQRIKDKAEADLAEANARIKEISDNAASIAKEEQIYTATLGKAATIAAAPEPENAAFEAHQKLMSDKRRRDSSTERAGRARLTPPTYYIVNGSLGGPFIQIRLGQAKLASILKNYHKENQKRATKCLIRTCPDEENDVPDLFFFAETVQGKAAYHDCIEMLRKAKNVFFDVEVKHRAKVPPKDRANVPTEDCADFRMKGRETFLISKTEFTIRPNHDWHVRMNIAKPMSGNNYILHPLSDFNVSLWPQWTETGFSFSGIRQTKNPPKPSTEPAQLQLTAPLSAESAIKPAQLQPSKQMNGIQKYNARRVRHEQEIQKLKLSRLFTKEERLTKIEGQLLLKRSKRNNLTDNEYTKMEIDTAKLDDGDEDDEMDDDEDSSSSSPFSSSKEIYEETHERFELDELDEFDKIE